MDQRNTYDFSSLSERISAQTEAYVEFSNALVKIIEQTAAIRDRITHSNDTLEEEYKNLNNKFQELLIEFTKYSSDNSNQHSLFGKDLEAFKLKLLEFESKLNILMNETSKSDELLSEMAKELIIYSKKITEQIHQNNEETKTTIGKITTQLGIQTKSLGDFKKSFDKFKYFLWAIGTIVAIFSALKGFGIIDINWLVNNNPVKK
jgi:hypothetical protein